MHVEDEETEKLRLKTMKILQTCQQMQVYDKSSFPVLFKHQEVIQSPTECSDHCNVDLIPTADELFLSVSESSVVPTTW